MVVSGLSGALASCTWTSVSGCILVLVFTLGSQVGLRHTPLLHLAAASISHAALGRTRSTHTFLV